jgi:hypothetical protein
LELTMRQPSLAAPALLLTLIATSCDNGCSAEHDSFTWRGERVTVYGTGYKQSDACAGSLDALDTQVQMVEDFLGVDSGRRYRFWWFSDDRWAEVEPCPPDALACANHDGVALSRNLPHMHEAVHMITHAIGDDGCPLALNEGLAEYFEDPVLGDWLPSEDYPITELLAVEEFPSSKWEAYVRAAHFVAYLIRWYGGDSVRRLCEVLPRKSTLQDWESAVPEVLGLSLAELIADYEEDQPICSLAQFRSQLWGCTGIPDYIFDSDRKDSRRFEVEADCSDPRATNAAFGKRNAALTRLVYFPTDAWIRVRASADGESGVGATMIMRQCVPCHEDPQIIRQGDNPYNIYNVRAGFHEVTVFFNKQDPVHLRMSRLP